MNLKPILALTGGLALGLGTMYTIDRGVPAATRAYNDTKYSGQQTIDGFHPIGNLGDVTHDAYNDIVNRHPLDAANEFSRYNGGYDGPHSGTTPLMDRHLAAAHYRNSSDEWGWFSEKTDNHPFGYLCSGLGGLWAAGMVLAAAKATQALTKEKK